MLWSAFRRRYRKYEEALEHIDELEQELGLAPTRSLAAFQSRITDVRGPTYVTRETQTKKVDTFIPVLDDAYFERKRPSFLSASDYSYYGATSYYGGASWIGIASSHYPRFP